MCSPGWRSRFVAKTTSKASKKRLEALHAANPLRPAVTMELAETLTDLGEKVYNHAVNILAEANAPAWRFLLVSGGLDGVLPETTKTLRTRVVPIVPALRPWLAYVPIAYKDYEGLKTAFQRARIAAEMPWVNFHDLRHSCASILLASGADSVRFRPALTVSRSEID